MITVRTLDFRTWTWVSTIFKSDLNNDVTMISVDESGGETEESGDDSPDPGACPSNNSVLSSRGLSNYGPTF